MNPDGNIAFVTCANGCPNPATGYVEHYRTVGGGSRIYPADRSGTGLVCDACRTQHTAGYDAYEDWLHVRSDLRTAGALGAPTAVAKTNPAAATAAEEDRRGSAGRDVASESVPVAGVDTAAVVLEEDTADTPVPNSAAAAGAVPDDAAPGGIAADVSAPESGPPARPEPPARPSFIETVADTIVGLFTRPPSPS